VSCSQPQLSKIKKAIKKEITCFKFKKVEHYSNECDEEETVRKSNKKGSNFLVLNKDRYNSSSDEEGTGI